MVNVLLVDDDHDDLLALRTALDLPEYHLVTATSGEAALRELNAADFAAVFLDVVMPGMDGFETARRIRLQAKSAHVPILFLTGVATGKQDRDIAYAAGAVDVLAKPADEFELRAKLAIFAEFHRIKASMAVEAAEGRALWRDGDLDDVQQGEVQERAGRAMGKFAAGHTTSVTASYHGEKTLREGAPDAFREVVQFFGDLLERAVDSQVHQTPPRASNGSQQLATKLGFLGAGARDVVEVHRVAVEEKCANRPAKRVKVNVEEGRYLMVEVLGWLLNYYRGQARLRPRVLVSRDSARESGQRN